MPRTRFVPTADAAGPFAALRHELGVPGPFPEAVEAEGRSSGSDGGGATDRRRGWVTLDPAGARDLDQALCLEPRTGGGWHLGYAIADVAAHVRPGGEVDAESHRRGVTIYLPDGKAPLHPTGLSEGRASLLPGQATAAVVWEIDIDEDGTTTLAGLERRTVTSSAQLTYTDPLEHPQLRLLHEAGPALLAAAAARGAVDLPEPSQEIERTDGGWRLVLAPPRDTERWNAQLSLAVGRAAGALQAAAGWGLLRTLPEADAADAEEVRRAAVALGHGWERGAPWGPAISAIDPTTPGALAAIGLAGRLLRGAGYAVLTGGVPVAEPPRHAAVASVYAHATAPLRRLADRYVSACCLAGVAGTEPPPWVVDGLPDLAERMTEANRSAAAVERAALDLVEALLLEGRVGEVFDAVALDARTVQLADPPVRARCDGPPSPGAPVRVRLTAADVATRSVRFAVVPP